jgi:flagellar hook protein FlgE
MTVARTMLDVAAHDVANVSTPGFRPYRATATEAPGRAGAVVGAVERSAAEPPAGMSGTDLAVEMPELIVAGATYSANAVALRTQDETTGSLLDVLAR